MDFFHYGNRHGLQEVWVYGDYPRGKPEKGYWVIYIHGGAWRDPEVQAKTFAATWANLCLDEEWPEIAGIASVNYRLSPHPKDPQDPSIVPPDQYRNAKHPDHISDVVDAIAFLQARYAFGERYILAGHSCGATLAFQTVMQKIAGYESNAVSLEQPLAIVGVCGIYDLRLLRDTNDHPIYQQFLEGAFGSNEEVWDGVSPAKVDHGGVAESWHTGRLAVLATSQNDSKIDPPQLEAMAKVLDIWKTSKPNHQREVLTICDLKDSHDGVWEEAELAGVISKTIKALRQMPESS